ncbi:leucine-rich repeat-containing protein 23-like [Zerene cesonia]|uniref:leucine-rich repeat-containing protein 23-like n=1 Tax=Zerene cesonia TaxID=33412 RepID=UPI0018E56031|nr:leucine-rich repeat-containing protein 23-like [Zerene cesonia]
MLKSHFNLQRDDNEEEIEIVPEEHAYHEHVGEEAGPDEEPIIRPPERVLNRSEISIRLSVLGKTAAGDGYTYLKATCTNMNLTEISAFKSFHHLQYIDVSNNNLNSESLQVLSELPFLLLIHADKNNLNSAYLKRMKYLQVVIFNNNRISSVRDVYHPEMSTVEVGYNKILNIYFENRMPNLKCLDFRYNSIHDISDMDFPNLDSLYLAGNRITSLVGIAKLPNLRILHVRNNPIKLLNGFEPIHKKLQYLNLRNTKVTTLKQIKKLRVLPALETLVIKGCPYMGGTGEEDAEVADEEENPEQRVEVLASLPRLKRLNKGVITPEERTEANDLIKQWIEEGENDEEEIEDEHNEQESNEEN